VEIISPNNVLANAMLRSVDMVRPRLQAMGPDRVAFCVGTQINGAPHLGTALVQTAAFLLAKATKRTFNVDAVVRFGALDNARTTSVWTPRPTMPTSRPTSTPWAKTAPPS